MSEWLQELLDSRRHELEELHRERRLEKTATVLSAVPRRLTTAIHNYIAQRRDEC